MELLDLKPGLLQEAQFLNMRHWHLQNRAAAAMAVALKSIRKERNRLVM
jgi:hypothetical protein